MIRNSTRRIAILMLVSDVCATLFALAAAYLLRFRAEIIAAPLGIPDVALYYRLGPLIAVLWPAVYYFYGLYQVRRNRSRVEESRASTARHVAGRLPPRVRRPARGSPFRRRVGAHTQGAAPRRACLPTRLPTCRPTCANTSSCPRSRRNCSKASAT